MLVAAAQEHVLLTASGGITEAQLLRVGLCHLSDAAITGHRSLQTIPTHLRNLLDLRHRAPAVTDPAQQPRHLRTLVDAAAEDQCVPRMRLMLVGRLFFRKLLADYLPVREILGTNFQVPLANALEFEIALISLKEGQIQITRDILWLLRFSFGLIHRNLLCTIDCFKLVVELFKTIIIGTHCLIKHLIIRKPYIGQIVTDQRPVDKLITHLLLTSLVARAGLQQVKGPETRLYTALTGQIGGNLGMDGVACMSLLHKLCVKRPVVVADRNLFPHQVLFCDRSNGDSCWLEE